MKQVLIIDDDKELCALMKKCIEQENLSAVTAYSGIEGLQIIKENQNNNGFSLIILYVMMPYMDGFQVLKKIREVSNIPVLMLTAKSNEEDKVLGLRLGADDYLTKPFGVMELIARVKAVLRRTMEEDKFLTLGDIFLDDEKHMVYVKDVPCSLTFKEYELLKLLLHNAGIVVTREIILERVWGIDFEGESRTLDMHIRTLRQKLGEAGSMIRTVRNVGYMIE